MFDIVNFWKNKVAEWNLNNQCGFCFEFSAPLFESENNIQQNENCCAKVFLTNVGIKSNYRDKINAFGFRELEYCSYYFNLYIVVQSELGINNYNEIIGHPIDESKWETIFNPLINCFGCNSDLCSTIENFNGYRKWDVSLVHNYLDNVYNGIKINAEIIINAN